VCNGEIYNYKELARKYEIELTSGSDCEIIGPLFKKIGMDRMMKEFDAEFMTVICEINKKTKNVTVSIGRDHCGIRPAYIGQSDKTLVVASEMKAIPRHLELSIRQFPPRMHATISSDNVLGDLLFTEYTNFGQIRQTVFDREVALELIKTKLIESVESRMMSDKEFACLLSGGLDSSLVSSIASRICKSRGKRLKTYCVAISETATDVAAAKMVASHIDSDHTTVIIPKEEWLQAVKHVIYTIESYDITTIRASTGQYLISKWIAKNTNIKVLLIGDGSDELTGGYIYMLKAPNHAEFQAEILKLLNEIHYYDVLRSDRGIASNGIEARVPFLSRPFMEAYLSISTELRMPTNGVEKSLLRDAFKNTDYLPHEILYRKKEAFSDGVSSVEKSWFTMLKEYIETIISDADFEVGAQKYSHCKPPHKEALYYRQIFEEFFGRQNTIPHFWLPNWSGNTTEPSARVLANYKSTSV
jgi:asparagine synthase (glutamine-hydrolysing)